MNPKISSQEQEVLHARVDFNYPFLSFTFFFYDDACFLSITWFINYCFFLKHDLEFLIYNCYNLFLNFNYLHITNSFFLNQKQVCIFLRCIYEFFLIKNGFASNEEAYLFFIKKNLDLHLRKMQICFWFKKNLDIHLRKM